MNIAFWGEEHQCGTTAHMLAVMGMLSLFYPQARIRAEGPGQPGDLAFRFYDCGTGLTGRRRQILRGSDLAVINLRQEKACIERFFSEHFHISGKLFFLLEANAHTVGADERYLERMYRVAPEQIGVIPFNNDFYCALSRKRGMAFVKREGVMPKSAVNEQFITALRATTSRMVSCALECR